MAPGVNMPFKDFIGGIQKHSLMLPKQNGATALAQGLGLGIGLTGELARFLKQVPPTPLAACTQVKEEVQEKNATARLRVFRVCKIVT